MISDFVFFTKEEKILTIIVTFSLIIISLILYIIGIKYEDKIRKSNNKIIKFIFLDKTDYQNPK